MTEQPQGNEEMWAEPSRSRSEMLADRMQALLEGCLIDAFEASRALSEPLPTGEHRSGAEIYAQRQRDRLQLDTLLQRARRVLLEASPLIANTDTFPNARIERWLNEINLVYPLICQRGGDGWGREDLRNIAHDLRVLGTLAVDVLAARGITYTPNDNHLADIMRSLRRATEIVSTVLQNPQWMEEMSFTDLYVVAEEMTDLLRTMSTDAMSNAELMNRLLAIRSATYAEIQERREQRMREHEQRYGDLAARSVPPGTYSTFVWHPIWTARPPGITFKGVKEVHWCYGCEYYMEGKPGACNALQNLEMRSQEQNCPDDTRKQ